MTAGISGAGIGGLFYLLNALYMPLRELWLAWHGRSSPETRRVVKRQFAIAVGIIAGMWITAWTISLILTTQPRVASFAGVSSQDDAVQNLPRLLSYSALTVGGVALTLVLLSVALLRFMVTPKSAVKSVSARRFVLILALARFLPCTMAAQMVDHLERADAAFHQEDGAVAAREYRAALQINPDQSHATFRLAELMEKQNPEESEQLYRRYTELEPADVWGYIVLAEFLGRGGRYDEALALYLDAVRRAPNERDAVCGRARMLAKSGHTAESIRTYNEWLESHPSDKTASSEVELQRRLIAPTIEPVFSFSRDSDGNTRIRNVIGGDFAVFDRARLGLTVGQTRVSDALGTRTFNDFMFNTKWRPGSVLQLDAAGGAAHIDQQMIPIARVRMLARTAANTARFDLRVNRSVLDATPSLTANRLVRSEVQVRPDVALASGFRVRGVGGMGWINGPGEENKRYTMGGGTAWNVAPAVEVSANFTQIRYARPSQAGYFASQRIYTVDIGSYMEFETETALIALDFGAGGERFKEHTGAFGSWRPAYRGYGLLAFRLRPGRELRVELDGYNTKAGPVAAPTSGWKYGSISTSLRWSF